MKNQRSKIKDQKVIHEHSAGGVVFQQSRIMNNGSRITEWLICKHSGYHKWVLPKGIVEEREQPEETAVREVREETGITARIIKKIEPDVRYTYRKGDVLVRKRVTFYLMEYILGDIANRNWEMEDARWTTLYRAAEMLAFPTEQRILESAANFSSHKPVLFEKSSS